MPASGRLFASVGALIENGGDRSPPRLHRDTHRSERRLQPGHQSGRTVGELQDGVEVVGVESAVLAEVLPDQTHDTANELVVGQRLDHLTIAVAVRHEPSVAAVCDTHHARTAVTGAAGPRHTP